MREGTQQDTMAREDSTEATLAMLLTEAAASVSNTTPAERNNVPSSQELRTFNRYLTGGLVGFMFL